MFPRSGLPETILEKSFILFRLKESVAVFCRSEVREGSSR